MVWKAATSKKQSADSILPPFLFDWDDADLESDQLMPSLGDLMQDTDLRENQQILDAIVMQLQPQDVGPQFWEL